MSVIKDPEVEKIKQEEAEYKKLLELNEHKGWTVSNVMKVYHKRFLKVLDAAKKVYELGQEYLSSKVDIKSIQDRPGYKKLYVVLFQVDGSNMLRWEVLLKSIKSITSGRPIFEEEEAARVASTRTGNSKTGYVSIWVNEMNIIDTPATLALKDVNGYKIVTLRQNSLNPANIIYFVHGTDVIYDYVNYKLIRKN